MAYKVVLIQPKLTSNWVYSESKPFPIPVGILTIGTILKKNNYNVTIIDALIDPFYIEKIRAEARNKPLLVGISAMTSQVPDAYNISRIIKEMNGDIPIVWGGIHATLFPKETCESSYIDYVCHGEGEYACLELANALNAEKSIEDIKGIAYRKNGSVYINPRRELLDINAAPVLQYELLDIENYLKRDYGHTKVFLGQFKRTLSILTGLGCVYSCTFCVNDYFYKKKGHRAKEATKILDEIEYVINKDDIGSIHMRDENFLLNKNRLFDFLDGIEERGLKFNWFCLGRIEYLRQDYINDAVLDRMVSLGCFRISFGLESGSDKVLKILKKGFTVEQIHSGTAILRRKKKVRVGSAFLMGIPGEDENDLLKTVRLIKQLKKENRKFLSVGPMILQPYPGCEIYQECLRRGYREPQSLEEWANIDFESSQFTGFTSIKSMPWIKNPEMVTLINFYSRVLDFSLFRYLPIKMWWLKFFEISRCYFNFWKFPIEMKIWSWLPERLRKYQKKVGIMEEVFDRKKR